VPKLEQEVAAATAARDAVVVEQEDEVRAAWPQSQSGSLLPAQHGSYLIPSADTQGSGALRVHGALMLNLSVVL
jgi:hypothetical protein